MTPVHHAINYVEITVTDMDAAQHFYGTAFGWRFTDYAPAYAGIQAPEGDGEVGGLSLGRNVELGGPLVLLYSDDLFTGEDTNVAKFELYKSSNGEYRWRLKSSNGQVIVTGGEGYSSRAGAQGGIDAVKRVAATAPVEDA
jgi:uncharacterized protein YegP (UPF0339 family)